MSKRRISRQFLGRCKRTCVIVLIFINFYLIRKEMSFQDTQEIVDDPVDKLEMNELDDEERDDNTDDDDEDDDPDQNIVEDKINKFDLQQESVRDDAFNDQDIEAGVNAMNAEVQQGNRDLINFEIDDTDMNGVVEEAEDPARKGVFVNRKSSKNRPKFGNFDVEQFVDNDDPIDKFKLTNKKPVDDKVLVWDSEIGLVGKDDADAKLENNDYVDNDEDEIDPIKVNEFDSPQKDFNKVNNKKKMAVLQWEPDEIFQDQKDQDLEEENSQDKLVAQDDIDDQNGAQNNNDLSLDETFDKDALFNEDKDSSRCLATSKFVRDGQSDLGQKSLECPMLLARTERECLQEEMKAKTFFTDKSSIKRIQNCQNYFQKIDTVAFKRASKEELSIPLAFSIVAHSQLGMIEAQLATLFRPHNSYCIYIDKKAQPEFRAGVDKLISCYKDQFGPNINLFIAPNPISIFWSDFSLIQADLECLEILLENDIRWEFFLNQAGSALPQVSLFELVDRLLHLQATGGDSVIISRPFPEKYRERINFKYRRPSQTTHSLQNTASFGQGMSQSEIKRIIAALEMRKKLMENDMSMYADLPKRTYVRKEKPPYGLTVFKGLKEVVFSRELGSFFIESRVAKAFRTWCEDITFAEEIFFSTLIRVSRDIYEKTGKVIQEKDPDLDTTNGLCVRRTLWEESVKFCHGEMKRYICNLALLDMPEALERDCLFLNKFDLSVDPTVVSCLHQHWILQSNNV